MSPKKPTSVQVSLTPEQFMEAFHAYLNVCRGDWEALLILFEDLTGQALTLKPGPEFSSGLERMEGEIDDPWLLDHLRSQDVFP